MKKTCILRMLFYLCGVLLFIQSSTAQLTIGSSTKWVGSPGTYVTLENTGLQCHTTVSLVNTVFQFSGNQSSVISGSAQPGFHTILVSKTGSGNLQLNRDIDVANTIRFKSGLLNLHNNHIFLASAAFLQNESETSRITDTGSGFISISINLPAPAPVNPGNLGAYLSSASYSGIVSVERGHHVQTISGITPNSIARTYNVQVEDKGGINALMRLYYFDAEKRGLDENKFVIWRKNIDDSWNNIGASARDVSANYTEQNGLNGFGFFTLSPSDILPVHGLQLSGIWKNDASVLTWTTLTEINNHHFEIERKYPEENSFVKIATVASKHLGGNSSSPALYQYNDATVKANAATVLYRLKQVDNNGQSFYSNTIVVTPSGIREFIHKVYPTIVTGNTLFIQAGNMDLQTMQVQIFDAAGKRLFNQTLPYQSQLITLPTVTAGSYRLLIQSGSYTFKSMFIK